MKVLSDPKVKTLVLDVLRPHSPALPEFAAFLSELEGINRVNITLIEMDERTESLRVVINGSTINFDALKKQIEKYGGVIHSVDQVIAEK